MRTTILAGISALALLAGPALAGGASQSGASGTSAGAADRSDTGSMAQGSGSGGMSSSPSQTPGAGGAPQTGALDKEQVRSALEAHGFTNVGEPTRVGDLYQVEAEKDGQMVTLVIDPVTGQAAIAE